MRRVTRADFPLSWQAGEILPQSHNLRYYGIGFLIRLYAQTRARLEELSNHFGKPVVAVIRQLIVQLRMEAFPVSWQMAVDERQQEGHV
jgi:hypothetical protein